MKPGEYDGDWYMAMSGYECWHRGWDDPYIIDCTKLVVWKETKSNIAAGPFDTLEAAKAAYLMLRDG